MSQHSSLKSGRKRKRHRSVLKRYERIRMLKDKKEWGAGETVFGLPKVKMIRIKVKKEKAAAEAAPAEAGQAVPPTPTTATPTAAPSGKEKVAPKREKEK